MSDYAETERNKYLPSQRKLLMLKRVNDYDRRQLRISELQAELMAMSASGNASPIEIQRVNNQLQALKSR